MKQLLQSLSTGSVEVTEIPAPQLKSHHVLIRTSCSLLSSGTERMLVEFGRSNLLDKAFQQPDKVQQVVDKAKTDGFIATLQSVRTKLDQPLALGYCNTGTVIAVGSAVTGFKPGDRVASNGPHAEIVSVPQTLCALVPSGVSDETASFTVLASIGLQGIRLANPTLGETFVVSGLGLIGLLTAQLLQAQGCRVLGLDPDPSKSDLAQSLGIPSLDLSTGIDPVAWCLDKTDGIGIDGALITASTKSTQPIHDAARACRQRGRIVLIGVTGLELRRDLFYKKELSFQVSCSYGPGRYDHRYEELGQDYPIGFVRWTEQRNLQSVLQAFASGVFRTDQLVSHRFLLEDAPAAYDLLSSTEPSLGIVLKYSADADPTERTSCLTTYPHKRDPAPLTSTVPLLSVLGAGNYSSRVLLPAFAKAGVRFHSLAATSGVAPTHVGRKFGFSFATTDVSSILSDPSCNIVVIATRHNTHSTLVQQALTAGKHVFVEKPLCLSMNELTSIQSVYTGQSLLMVGFNRRFAPLVIHLRRLLSRLTGPRAFVYTCNAGAIPAEHWTQDPSLGGGRLIGEACHFVDLLRHLADSPIIDLSVDSAFDSKSCKDTFSVHLRFEDGSIGTVHYFSNGSKSYPKERLEVFCAGKILQLDNFRKLTAWGLSGFGTRRTFSQDKGQNACCKAFLDSVKAGYSSPIPASELFEVQRWLLTASHK